MSQSATAEKQPKLEVIEGGGEKEGRAGFAANLFSEHLSDDNPVVIVDGDTRDSIPDGNGEYFRNILKPIEAEALKHYHDDVVMVYDTAENCIRFPNEGHKEVLEEQLNNEAITTPGSNENLIPIMLDDTVDKSMVRFHPDNILLQMMKKAAGKNLKVCLLVDDGDLFLCSSVNDGSRGSAVQRPLNNRAMMNFVEAMKEGGGESRIVFIDRTNKVRNDEQTKHLIQEVPVVSVPPPSAAETREMLKDVIDLDEQPEAAGLVKGVRLSVLQALVKKHGGKPDKDLLKELKAMKEKEIENLTDGLVKCSLKEYTKDMVAMPENEANFWNELAESLKPGSELLPQGCMMIGPPGTGKSVRARYMATTMGVPFLELHNMSGDGWRGKKEEKLRTILEGAIRVKPCILFIDEIDKAMPKTEGVRLGSSSDNDDSEVAALFQRMMDSPEMQGVFVIGAANDSDQMNEALLRHGRFGLRVACLPPTEISEKVKVLRAVSRQFEIIRDNDIKISDEMAKAVVTALEGASGADYKELIRRAASKWSIVNAKGGDMSFDAALVGCVKTFRFRRTEKIEEMIEKAVYMHTADFHLETDGNVEDDGEVGKVVELFEELQQKREELQAKLDEHEQQRKAEATEHADAMKDLQAQEAKLNKEWQDKMAQLQEEADETLSQHLSEIDAQVRGDGSDEWTLKRLKEVLDEVLEKLSKNFPEKTKKTKGEIDAGHKKLMEQFTKFKELAEKVEEIEQGEKIKQLWEAGIFPFKSVTYKGEKYYAGGIYNKKNVLRFASGYTIGIEGNWVVINRALEGRKLIIGFTQNGGKMLLIDFWPFKLQILDASDYGTFKKNIPLSLPSKTHRLIAGMRNDDFINGIKIIKVTGMPFEKYEKEQVKKLLELSDDDELEVVLTPHAKITPELLAARIDYNKAINEYIKYCSTFKRIQCASYVSSYTERVWGNNYSSTRYEIVEVCPDNDDFFCQRQSLVNDFDQENIDSMIGVTKMLEERNVEYSRVIELLRERDFETLFEEFPDGTIDPYYNGE